MAIDDYVKRFFCLINCMIHNEKDSLLLSIFFGIHKYERTNED